MCVCVSLCVRVCVCTTSSGSMGVCTSCLLVDSLNSGWVHTGLSLVLYSCTCLPWFVWHMSAQWAERQGNHPDVRIFVVLDIFIHWIGPGGAGSWPGNGLCWCLWSRYNGASSRQSHCPPPPSHWNKSLKGSFTHHVAVNKSTYIFHVKALWPWHQT